MAEMIHAITIDSLSMYRALYGLTKHRPGYIARKYTAISLTTKQLLSIVPQAENLVLQIKQGAMSRVQAEIGA